MHNAQALAPGCYQEVVEGKQQGVNVIVVDDDGCLGEDEIERLDGLVQKARAEDRVMKGVYWLFGLGAVGLVLRVIFGEPYGGM